MNLSAQSRANALVGYEPRGGLTVFCAVEYSVARNHTVQASDRAGGDELLALAGVAYAWDLRPIAARGSEPPPPAAISMTTARVSGVVPEAAARIDSVLRSAIPRLRIATVAVERAAGCALGEMAIDLQVTTDGRITDARIEDHTACPERARAVREFLLRQRLPGQDHAATVSLVLGFR